MGALISLQPAKSLAPLPPPPPPPPPPPKKKKKKKFKAFLRLCYFILLNKMITEIMAGLGCDGPSRHYFSLYRAVSQTEGERKRNNRREKELFKPPQPHLLQAQLAFALLLSRLVERPGTESYPSPSPDRYYPRLSL